MKLVYVAMSGGVDSSVVAALLKKRGFDVVGVFMKPWSPNLSTVSPLPTCEVGYPQGRGNDSFCMWKEDREDAMRVASVLGIPLKTWDFSKEYKKFVTDYMIREYRAGRTPNPDVMCNKEIKFGLFFDEAMKEGADFIATGHYVKIKQGRGPAPHHPGRRVRSADLHATGVPTRATPLRLFMAKDKNKDQSYFLWTLRQTQLEKCLFPIGDYLKPEVRKMAKKFGLPNHDKKDSQGVCFIGPLDMKDFLQTKIKTKIGKIMRLDGKYLGNHDGVYYYTIGQRHGLNVGIGGGPYYVVSKDIKKNIIYVGSEKDLLTKKTKVSEISWVNNNIISHFFSNKGHLLVDVKIRYRSKSEKAILSKNGTLKFLKPIRAITSGQSAVFYRKGELLGGGIIK